MATREAERKTMYPGVYAKTQPDKIAVHRPSTGERLTYAQLDRRSNQLARLLRAQGLRRGDHVAIFMENHLVYFDAIWACLRSGLYLTSVNRHLTAAEAAYIVDDCDARALVASAAVAESAELGRLASRCEIKLAAGGAIPGFADYEEAIGALPGERLADEAVGTFMLYSAGTTGRPKGILRPLPEGDPAEGNVNLSSRSKLFGFNPSTVYLSPAPMYHGAPVGTTACVHQEGGTVVMMDRFDAELSLKLIERYRVTHSQWVPTMFVRMLKLDAPVRAKYDLSSHHYALHAAAPCPVEVKRQMIEWWGPIIEEYYSSSENVGLTMISSREWLEHPGSVGKSCGRPFHICDEAGAELPAGEAGLLYGDVGVGAFSYYKDAAKTGEAVHATNPAWMTVGDVGFLDADGYLYLTDRKAFMIISGGVNIYPQQIEDALALHPKIADVAVIGVPNADLGEEVKAVVEPAQGVEPSDALAREIMDFVTARLGRQLTPRSVDFTDALPRLPTGKLYKKALREKYWGAGSDAVPLAARL
jgi:fatty-acyl-CoA synthase